MARITGRMHGFVRSRQPERRAAISVVSHICEGASSGSDPQFARYLIIARASTHELQGQLAIVIDLGQLDPITRSTTAAIISGGHSPSRSTR